MVNITKEEVEWEIIIKPFREEAKPKNANLKIEKY